MSRYQDSSPRSPGPGRRSPSESRQPIAEVGEVALLKVVTVNATGAFLDWGRPKDLLLPFGEQDLRPAVGKSVLVKINVDDSGRPVASMRLNRFITDEAEGLATGDAVTLVIGDRTELGVKAVVEHRFWGLLYHDEYQAVGSRPPRRGERLTGYVKRIRDDGRLDLTLQPLGGARRDLAGERIMAALEDGQGFLALNDKSPASAIKARLGISKSAFKQAIGGLYRQRRIRLEADGIRRLEPDADPGTAPAGD
ncbi:S1-like domain-containing RNA-binding protein [Halomonas sp. HP20-15]|uniref:CvfB family protein n=1 Tax=Halomonas sp. HP20-15 TaxID=3085901 RepID=UPI00298255B1|nr:S1-like domain-containing RNA-binding protein [Halomonas sp. HP20-15]MDW5375966.1 S1-like domain-containing RNA-binding protein [Halomonas sp. HP20-15]